MLYGAAVCLPSLRPSLVRWGLRTRADWFSGCVPTARSRVTKQSLRLPSFSRNYLSFELFWRGLDYYEPLTAWLLNRLAASSQLFVDAGANIGYHTLRLAAARPDLEIVAFEPNPKLHAMLEENLDANRLARVKAEPIALSDHAGVMPLYLAWSDMSASLLQDFDEKPIGVVDVPVDSLDHYLASRGDPPRRFLLKVDVEGHEPAFFAGAAETIRRHRPDIIAEVTTPWPRATVDMLYRCGYRFRQVTDDGLVPCVEPAARLRGPFVFLNCLLTTRPSAELEDLSADLRAHARRIDLNQTSKRADRQVVARCRNRGRGAAAASRPPTLAALPGPWPGPQTR